MAYGFSHNSKTLNQQEKASLGIKLSEFPPVVLNHLKQYIKHIDTNYPWSVSPNLELFLLTASYCIELHGW